ncbi:hypothetical protein NE865_00941 [Phthorimaea operculella]|nr:hypothetical protein NE865_00941 [Phthorimaea operculella]
MQERSLKLFRTTTIPLRNLYKQPTANIINFEYQVIDLQGKTVILCGGYTFSKSGSNQHVRYCSQKRAPCRARLRFNAHGYVVEAHTEHTHPPPRILVTASGKYVRLG